jgi:glycosyltransferase involved in cell wall biosynthesis
LCADSSQVVVVRLSFEGRHGARKVAGEAVDDSSVGRTSFLVRLVAGESRELFDIEALAQTSEFTLCRVGGEPCVLRLRIDDEVDTNAQEVPAIPSRRAPSKGTLWKAQELLREGCAERAMEVALAYATEVERPALALLRATLAIDDAEWLANVNAYVEPFGITPIRLEKANASRFLRLAADAPRFISGGPLITVIMPAFNAETTLELAAGSILKQSWTEIELIIVDDFSADGTWGIAQRIQDLDARVRLLRNDVNVGPYVSKNLAMSMARGAYITCHDADDWAHPQRLEGQIEAMKSNGAAARACVGSWLRLKETGAFTGFTGVGRQSHDGALRLAHVTCMVESEFMRRYVGHWDCVRFGADGEMIERLERILGDGLLRLRQLSALSLDAPRSLTNNPVHGISNTGGLSLTRRAYRDAWRQWHAAIKLESAYIDFPQTRRPFVAPDACVVPFVTAEQIRMNTGYLSHADR